MQVSIKTPEEIEKMTKEAEQHAAAAALEILANEES